MSDRATTILGEVLAWPADERGELAARLLETLDADADADAAEAWGEEIRTRLEDVRSGKVTPIPWAEALRQIEADDNGVR